MPKFHASLGRKKCSAKCYARTCRQHPTCPFNKKKKGIKETWQQWNNHPRSTLSTTQSLSLSQSQPTWHGQKLNRLIRTGTPSNLAQFMPFSRRTSTFLCAAHTIGQQGLSINKLRARRKDQAPLDQIYTHFLNSLIKFRCSYPHECNFVFAASLTKQL